MRNNLFKFYLIVVLAVMLSFIFNESASASDLDALIGGDSVQTEQSEVAQQTVDTVQPTVQSSTPIVEENQSGTGALIDAIKGQNGMTQESVKKADALSRPIISLFNVAVSFLVLVSMASIFLMTAFDLFFLAVPPVRGLMYPMYNQVTTGGGVQGGMMSPMGGGFGGFGSRYGMMGGMGGSMQTQQDPSFIRRQYVSDEAVKAIGLIQAQPQQQQSGMGMGFGMMQQQPQQPVNKKIAIVEYLKMRTVFILVFTFATVFLTSSLITGYGLKLFSFVEEQLLHFM